MVGPVSLLVLPDNGNGEVPFRDYGKTKEFPDDMEYFRNSVIE